MYAAGVVLVADAISFDRQAWLMPAEWILKRNCSASPRLLACAFASVAAVSFAFGAGFAAFGFWMVLPFVGIEIAAVATAFFVYARHAADYQRIEIGPEHVVVETVRAQVCDVHRFPTAWAGLRTDTDLPTLGVGTQRVPLGIHLTPQRRRQLMTEISRALRAARDLGVARPATA